MTPNQSDRDTPVVKALKKLGNLKVRIVSSSATAQDTELGV